MFQVYLPAIHLRKDSGNTMEKGGHREFNYNCRYKYIDNNQFYNKKNVEQKKVIRIFANGIL